MQKITDFSDFKLQINSSQVSKVCDKEPVGHVKKEEIGMIPEARRASETADIKHELKHVIYSRRLAKGLDHLEIPTTADNKPTIEKVLV